MPLHYLCQIFFKVGTIIRSIITPRYSFEMFFFFCQKIENLSEILKKAFHYFLELIETHPLIYNTLQFDQYSQLAILLNIFQDLAKISKNNLKVEKQFFIGL